MRKALTAKTLIPKTIYQISVLKHCPSILSYKKQNIRLHSIVKVMKILNLQVLALIARGTVECGNQKKVLLML